MPAAKSASGRPAKACRELSPTIRQVYSLYSLHICQRQRASTQRHAIGCSVEGVAILQGRGRQAHTVQEATMHT